MALPKKHSLDAPEEDDTRGLLQIIGSSRLNLQTFFRFSFTNTNDSYDPVERDQSIFKHKSPGGGGLIVHQAKRIPLLKFPKLSFGGIFCLEYPSRRSEKVNFCFANYRFSFRKLQIFISFRFISFRKLQ